ncbi:MAG: hypothetical protein J0H71_10750 [Rhizobiales bacterium]|nr:hypothetical protein [Hyphomicrobiales bacterium]
MLLEELPADFAGDVTRAASLPSAVKRIDWKLWSTKEGVGETSGQPVGLLDGSLMRPAGIRRKDGSATKHSSYGVEIASPQSLAALPRWTSALTCSPTPSFFCRRPCLIGRTPGVSLFTPSATVVAPHRFVMPRRFIVRERRACTDGYRFAKRQGKSAIQE